MSKKLMIHREFLIDIAGRYLQYLIAYAEKQLNIPFDEKGLLERSLTAAERAILVAFMDGIRMGVKKYHDVRI